MPLNIPPGLYKNGTEYQSQGRYRDANGVRFISGLPRPIGGWEKITATQLDGAPRNSLAWKDNSGRSWIAIGTSTKLYVVLDDTLHDITPVGYTAGTVDTVFSGAYGTGLYGSGVYGVPDDSRTSPSPTRAAYWTLDTWGEDLVCVANHEGIVYDWSPTNDYDDVSEVASVAAAVSGAPVNAKSLVVTEERFLMLFGGDQVVGGEDRRGVRWSDREDNTSWTPSATVLAGDFPLTTAGEAITGARVRGQTLVWTNVDVHVAEFIGAPLVYGFRRVGDDGIVGPGAYAVFEGKAAWMSPRGFHLYEGGYTRPIPCEVYDYVFGDFNTGQAAKVTCDVNRAFDEVWWYYPSGGSYEPDRYVVWNYRDNIWFTGTLGRSSWHDGNGVTTYPIATTITRVDAATPTATGYLFRHETGMLNDGSSRYADIHITSGPLEVGVGERLFMVSQVLTDEKTQGDLTLTLKKKTTPNGPETESLYAIDVDGYTDVRDTARQIAIKFTPTADKDWSVGGFRFDIRTVGKR